MNARSKNKPSPKRRPGGDKSRSREEKGGARKDKPAAGRARKDPAGRAGGPDRERGPSRLWIYGRHAALAALSNPERRIKRVLAAGGALDWLAEARIPQDRLVTLREAARPEDFTRALHEGAVHQGLAVEVDDLPRARLKDACDPSGGRGPVLVLDQITDPHNIGAIFRSAAAFGARAIIVQERRTPPLAGALAKAAAGAVEKVPCVAVVNIARALEGLKGLGYFCAGLAGEASAPLGDIPRNRPVALVLGAEGEGLRRLVAETCDGLFSIPIERRMESLNVSNAAAVALYEIARRQEG